MSDLNSASATELARKRIEQLADAAGDQFEIVSELTREVEQGWLFFFNSSDFVRTRDPASALAGNGPLLVTRRGEVHELPSAIPWEDALRKL